MQKAPKKWLKNKKNNDIMEWHPLLAANPAWEEIPEREAFPEWFLDKEVIQKRKGRKPLNLNTERLPEEPDTTPPELAADAARRFGASLGITSGPPGVLGAR